MGLFRLPINIMNTTNSATTTDQLQKLFLGRAVGTTYKILGYVSGATSTPSDIVVKTQPDNYYTKIKAESFRILAALVELPELPGFSPDTTSEALSALLTSYSSTSLTAARSSLTLVEEGGYATGKEEGAVYLINLEKLSDTAPKRKDARVDLVRAKQALVAHLDLPIGRYLNSIKLTAGKFKSVEIV